MFWMFLCSWVKYCVYMHECREGGGGALADSFHVLVSCSRVGVGGEGGLSFFFLSGDILFRERGRPVRGGGGGYIFNILYTFFLHMEWDSGKVVAFLASLWNEGGGGGHFPPTPLSSGLYCTHFGIQRAQRQKIYCFPLIPPPALFFG